MNKSEFTASVEKLLGLPTNAFVNSNFVSLDAVTSFESQAQTNDVFSEKWTSYNDSKEKENLFKLQRDWYLSLYGFATEDELANFLKQQRIIFDAGCGLGYKAAWFAKLAPDSIVIGMDFSEACACAANNYKDIKNLFFIKGDIANTKFQNQSIDYVSCDQVIMHTEDPEATFAELTRITKPGGEIACYFYAKKALPRELLDDFFRARCKELTSEQLWTMSEQLTILGKSLSDLNLKFNAPDIPLLGIKGGEYDIQRFIYWNFIKCFWNEDLGVETSIATNFDWYSPSNARRFDEADVRALVSANKLQTIYFHNEPACYSGRFGKQLIQ